MKRTAMCVLMLLALAATAGCRDGLIEPEEAIEADAGPMMPPCFELAIVLPGADAPYETRGVLTNLIVIEARALHAEGDDDSIETLIERAADAVTSRFPAEAAPALRAHVDGAIGDAMDLVAAQGAF